MEIVNRSADLCREENIKVKLAKAGDKAAFCTLIDGHRLALYRVARGILDSDFDAADAIQETVISAYTHIGALNKDEYFKTWLIRILINECKKILRKSRQTIFMETVTDQAVLDHYPSDNAASDFVNRLDWELRQVIVLYYYEDFRVSEIARILRIPQGTVKSRLARARGKLLNLMSVKGEEKDEKR
ncbi:RNA polymerase, sigma-24 subunit, ECF subfamily [Syntrophobotulus glycolicus DSM 8271]|uniref:RNA polymerase, sigma-24 subunit, ECF subfamily n=1 Tax=Syntrophobotulus glycolicus (strain DSM 8271 / FlGlyR) TaxID=645991 RepID=F0SU81_SYNGF|nr:sigma-70 family RNA polymerase sigma factor [Syntrophobotulus glycolicus]ADY55464.1 RNA polymerase, sigma-24 subunit, ECF subfamily [Syntrophobotulus glycolicus DSM 8271]